jgi:predicted Zn-dependent protease
MAMMMGGQALAVQNQLNFSRDMEREADRMGYGLMAPAGFAPGLCEHVRQAAAGQPLNDNGSWPYLRSHPLTTQRMADMQARTRCGPGAQAKPPTLEHAMVSARARVLSARCGCAAPVGRPAGPAQLFPAEPCPAGRHAVCRHPRPAAAARSGRCRGDAAPSAALTQGDAAAQRQTLWLAAELALAAERPQQALQRLEQLPPAPRAQHRNPEAERTTLLQRAQALSMLHRSGEVAGALQTWVRPSPDAAAWQALARASRESGQPLRALRAEAEASVAHYDYAAAVDRFKAGQQLGQRSGAQADHFEASIIDTRLRAVQALLREQTAQR